MKITIEGLEMIEHKQLLSRVRGHDYAHPGETQAIELAMQSIQKNSNNRILDVGCGLGGTTNYLMKHNWGIPIGIDINKSIIEAASQKYPNIQFFNSDIIYAKTIFPRPTFNVFCLFSSFFSFSNQGKCLDVLSNIAKNNANLVVLDYLALPEFKNENPFKSVKNFNPISKVTIGKILQSNGWRLTRLIELNNEYKIWYLNIVNKLASMRYDLIAEFGKEPFIVVYRNFMTLLEMFEQNKLGGCITYATKF